MRRIYFKLNSFINSCVISILNKYIKVYRRSRSVIQVKINRVFLLILKLDDKCLCLKSIKSLIMSNSFIKSIFLIWCGNNKRKVNWVISEHVCFGKLNFYFIWFYLRSCQSYISWQCLRLIHLYFRSFSINLH